MSEPAQLIRDAPAPFSGVLDPDLDDSAPDFIIRSGDGIDLHVHSGILHYASTFFRNMLDAWKAGTVSPGDSQRDGKPIVELPELCAILHRLFYIAYPQTSLNYSLTEQTLDGVYEVHEAAQKYLFVHAQRALENMLADPALLDAHPHRIFAIARLRDLPDLARKAALSTLKSPVCPQGLLFPETEVLSASTFQKLHEFHHSCGEAAEKLASKNAKAVDYTNPDPEITLYQHPDHGSGRHEFIWWTGSQDKGHSEECRPQVEIGYMGDWFDLTPTPWFQHHIAVLAPKLRCIPTRDTVDKNACVLADVDRAMIKGCGECLEHAERHLVLFGEQLERRIEASNNALGGFV
ncbi:hypothetical protein B0H16DRAFT_102579 [Mycena metata]|uniref:BTB domain-containing protein n=1 Tax=Mycena metata TaxID=1033252 RepID=A0AAD7MXS6_9AGAR|nr:hypothetical protein B0H16DRAFT_102579 [Mycena metata]